MRLRYWKMACCSMMRMDITTDWPQKPQLPKNVMAWSESKVDGDGPLNESHVDLIAGNAALRVAGVPEPSHFAEIADGLDDVLTSSRYPDALPLTEMPAGHFTEVQARECIEWAQQIVNAVRDLLPNT